MTSPGFRPNEDDVRRVQKELLKRAGVGFFSCTLDGELLSLDDGCLRIFDIADQYPDPAALTGQNITALILEKGDSHDIIRAALQQADTHRDYEIQLTTLQGHVKWVLLNTIRIPGLPAGVQVVQAIIRDITECKSTEEALRESEVFIRTLVDNLPIDFWAMDTDGRYSMQNPLSIEYWGNLIGRHPEEVEMPQEVIESWRSNNRRVMAGETIHSEASFTINGLQRTFLQIVAPVRRDHHILGILGVDVDITEQKRVEEGLRKTTEQIQAIIVASPLAIIALTPDGIVTMWSPAAERIFGWSAQEAIGSYLPFVPENKKAEFTALRKRVLAGDVFTGVEASRVRKDGSSIEISISTAPLRDETGRVNGIISVVEDITGRKREQRELARAEERYRSIFENAGIGIFQTTPGGRFRNVNSAMAHILGYSSPEELIREMTDIANQLYIDPVARDVIIAQLRTAEKAIRVEANFRRKDRTIITVNMIIRTVRDEAGFPSYYEGFIEDITERKRTEEALDRERAFLSTAIDILPFSLTFVSLVDHTPHVIRANKASAEFLKDSNPDNWWQLQFLTPETHTPVTLEQWPVYRSLHGEIVRSAEEIVVRSDGRETPVLLNSAPIYVGNEIVAAVAALQDITELKAADRAKNEFLAVLSHELKTPLTSILGWTQAAIGEDYAFMKEALTIIERNAKRQSHILDDLLDVSRIVYGKFYIKLTETDFWALTMQSVDDLRQTLTEHHLSLDIEPPSVSLPIYADQHRIRQVVSNLLLNAIKFTPAGGIITLRGWRGDRYAGVAVSDTGLGIDPAMIPRLFRPFHQVGRTEQTGGLGLGLALVKGIIDLHGGKVRAESAGLGKGSTFIVELPLATPPR